MEALMRNDYCSNYLEHSAKGTTWRKKGAKYLKRVWKNGKWIYEYKITGQGYLKDANRFKEASDRYQKNSQKARKNANAYNGLMKKTAARYTESALTASLRSEASKRHYDAKSIAGIISNGKKKIESILNDLSKVNIKIETQTKDKKKK